MKKKILFVTQRRNDAIWIVDDSVKNILKSQNYSFDFFELNEKWCNKINIILNYILNILKLLYWSIWYNNLYFSWENPYVIFVKMLYPNKKIYMCVHHVEDYWGKTIIWKFIIKSVSKFIAISNFTKEQLIEIWARDQDIFINYNGISKEFYPEIIDNFTNFEYILYVGSEVERKNIGSLFQWFKNVVLNFPNIKLIKIWPSGDGTLEKENDFFVQRLWLENNIILLREKYYSDELRKYYSNAICYISVSKLEWFWLTIPEALACGCPVVASNITPFQEIIWNSQIIVNPESIEEISNWIIKYIKNKDFREKMSREWTKIAERFQWVENVQWLIQILNK